MKGADVTNAPKLLHISEAADTLGLSIRQVNALVEAKKLPKEVIARKTYIPAESISEYVRSIIDGAA